MSSKNEGTPSNTDPGTIVAEQSPTRSHKDDVSDIPRTSALEVWLVMTGLCLAVFLCGLDQTILSTAVPVISNEFRALKDVAWWSSAYLITMSTFQLFYGKLYTLFPVKAVFMIAVALFEIGSIICAAAPNSIALIVGRAIAGTGGAGIFSGSVLILAQIVPLEKRAGYTGIIASVFGIAAVLGPFVGGSLTDRATWRWCFGLNPPIGLVTLLTTAFAVPKSSASVNADGWKNKAKEFDIPGMLTLIVSVVCLILALEYGGVFYPWSNGRVIALLVLFVVFLLSFVVLHIFAKTKTIPLSVASNRRYWSGSLFGFCVSSGIYVAIVYLPVWFQAVKDASALRSGVMICPLIIGYAVFSILGGIGTSAVGYYMPFMVASTLLSSIGVGLMTTFKADTGGSHWIGYQVLYGFGVGLGIQNSLLVAQTVLQPSDIPIGVALVTLIQNLGGAVFIAIAQSIFQNSLRDDFTRKIPGFDPAILQSTGITNISGFFEEDQLPLVNELYTKAIIKVFYIVLALVCASIIGAVGAGTPNLKAAQAKQDTSHKTEPVVEDESYKESRHEL